MNPNRSEGKESRLCVAGKGSPHRFLLLMAALAGGILWALFYEAGADQGDGLRADGADAVSNMKEAREVDSADTLEDSLEPKDRNTATQETARRKAAVYNHSGVVQDLSGRPIGGASVMWTPFTSEDLLGDPRWGRTARVPKGPGVRQAWTNEDGRFSIPVETPEPKLGSVIWATHDHYLAGAVLLKSDRKGKAIGTTITLVAAEPMDVLVVDANDDPVAGALVEHLAIVPPATSPPDHPVLDKSRARAVLGRTALTGDDGRCSFAPFAGDQVLVASFGSGRSRPWRGPARKEIRLVVGQTFEVSGSLALPVWKSGYIGERRIEFFVQDGAVRRTLGCLRSVSEGAWGPVILPLIPGCIYGIRLEGSPIVPMESRFPAPQAGAALSFDLRAELGEELWFQALDEHEDVIPDAWVVIDWNENGEWTQLQTQAREDDYINAWSVPRGTVYYQICAPGYCPSARFQLAVPLPEPTVEKVILHRSGRLEGRCLYRGEPVQDFEIVLWAQGNRATRVRHAFFGRKDGEFVIEDAPAGTVLVLGGSSEHPGSEPVAVEVPSGGAGTVEVSLSNARLALGRIVDAGTRRPIMGATVQFYYTGVSDALTRWGPRYPANPDGSFEIPGLTTRESFYFIEAPSHSGYFSSVGPGEEALVDLGVIPLEQLQSLRIELVGGGQPGGLGFEGFQFRAHGPSVVSGSRFPLSGVLEFTDISAGEYQFAIDHPDGATTEFNEQLSAGKPWVVRHQVCGGRRVSVRLIPGTEVDESATYVTSVEFTSKAGRHVLQTRDLRGDGQAVFEAVNADRFQVTVFDGSSGDPLAVKGLSFGDGGAAMTADVSIDLGTRVLEVHVVDRTGDVVPQALVLIHDSIDWKVLYVGTTDSEGVAYVRGVPEEVVTVDLRRGAMGQQQGLTCDATRDSVKVVFRSNGRIDLQVMDGGTALEGVLCSIVNAWGTLDSTTPTDAGGQVRFESLGPGRYTVRAERRDCWPVEQVVEAREGGERVEVQVRRRGELAMEIVSGEGVSVEGRSVGLVSVEFGQDVGAWVGEGKVRCEGGLRSDEEGRILVEGLPRGPYRWSVVDDEGGVLKGEVEVPAGQRGAVRIHLP